MKPRRPSRSQVTPPRLKPVITTCATLPSFSSWRTFSQLWRSARARALMVTMPSAFCSRVTSTSTRRPFGKRSLRFVITPRPASCLGMKPGALPPISTYTPSLSTPTTVPLTTSPVVPTISFSSRAARKASSSKSNSSTVRLAAAWAATGTALRSPPGRPRPGSGPSKSAIVMPSSAPRSKSSSSERRGAVWSAEAVVGGAGRLGACGRAEPGAEAAGTASSGGDASGGAVSSLRINTTWGGLRGGLAACPPGRWAGGRG